MGSERWEYYVWVPRYFNLEDILRLTARQNGEVIIGAGATVWESRGQPDQYVNGGWPPRRVRITVEEIEQPEEKWGPLC